MHAWVVHRRRYEGEGRRRALIYGAGERGEVALRELRSARDLLPVGFLDDDPHKLGRVIHGLRVMGSLGDLPGLLEHERIAEVILSVAQLRGERMDSLRAICGARGAAVRKVRISLE